MNSTRHRCQPHSNCFHHHNIAKRLRHLLSYTPPPRLITSTHETSTKYRVCLILVMILLNPLSWLHPSHALIKSSKAIMRKRDGLPPLREKMMPLKPFCCGFPRFEPNPFTTHKFQRDGGLLIMELWGDEDACCHMYLLVLIR